MEALHFCLVTMVAVCFMRFALALKCYECSEDPGSVGKCGGANIGQIGNKTCVPLLNRCSTVRYTLKGTSLTALSCANSMGCDPLSQYSLCNDFNTTGDLESCNIKCCTGDLCNAPLVVTSSVPAPASSVSVTTTASAVTRAGPGTSSANVPTEKSEPTRIPDPTSTVSALSSSFGVILLAFILYIIA